MKYFFFTIAAVLFFSLKTTAQSASVADSTHAADSIAYSSGSDAEKVFIKTEQEASFPGGVNKWISYLQANLKADVPVKNGARRGRYTVIVKFIVSKSGIISAIEAETNYGYGMEQEVIRIIKKGPKWEPAMQNGRAVNAYRRQPITFVID